MIIELTNPNSWQFSQPKACLWSDHCNVHCATNAVYSSNWADNWAVTDFHFGNPILDNSITGAPLIGLSPSHPTKKLSHVTGFQETFWDCETGFNNYWLKKAQMHPKENSRCILRNHIWKHVHFCDITSSVFQHMTVALFLRHSAMWNHSNAQMHPKER